MSLVFLSATYQPHDPCCMNGEAYLEEVFIILFPRCIFEVLCQSFLRFVEPPILIDDSQLLDHMIVEAIQHDE